MKKSVLFVLALICITFASCRNNVVVVSTTPNETEFWMNATEQTEEIIPTTENVATTTNPKETTGGVEKMDTMTVPTDEVDATETTCPSEATVTIEEKMEQEDSEITLETKENPKIYNENETEED